MREVVVEGRRDMVAMKNETCACSSTSTSENRAVRRTVVGDGEAESGDNGILASRWLLPAMFGIYFDLPPSIT